MNCVFTQDPEYSLCQYTWHGLNMTKGGILQDLNVAVLKKMPRVASR